MASFEVTFVFMPAMAERRGQNNLQFFNCKANKFSTFIHEPRPN